MKLTEKQKTDFLKVAQDWASATLDYREREAALFAHVEALMASTPRKRREFIDQGVYDHYPTRSQQAAQRDADDGLAAIDAHIARTNRRLAEDQRREAERSVQTDRRAA